MQQTTITYQSNNKAITTEVFKPVGSQNGGLIILAYGSDGLVDNNNGAWKAMIEGYAADLATRGFTAAIPNYFESTGTLPGQLDVNDSVTYAKQIAVNRDKWQKTLHDAAVELVKPTVLQGTDASRVGLLGFSLGGHLCARLAPLAKAMVVFFAPYMDGLGLIGQLSLHVEIHHGENDFIPYATNAQAIQKDLMNLSADSKLWDAYKGAVHGFVGSDPANTDARAKSHTRTMSFFEATL